jgi:hypothetical protein
MQFVLVFVKASEGAEVDHEATVAPGHGHPASLALAHNRPSTGPG